MAIRKRGRPSSFERHSPRLMRSWAQPPDRNTAEFLLYFNRNPRLAVVDVIASDLAIASGRLFEVDEDGNEQEVTDHPFLTLMKQPSPMYELTAAATWRLFQIWLELKGEGYFIIERDIYGRPRELWPVPPHWVMETPHMDFPYYRITVLQSGYTGLVSIDDMFVMKTIDPYDPYGRGKGTAEAIADELEIDEYAAKFQKRFFYNDATPSIVLRMGDAADPSTFPTEAQKETFVERLINKFMGMRNRSGIAAVDANVEVIKLSESMKDMDMVPGREFIRNAVLEHYGVPREIMGITENSNRSTSENAQYIYTSRVLRKRLLAREEAINTQILARFGEKLVWRYDEIVPDDATFKLQVANEGLSRGVITINEWREANGFELIDNGDVLVMPSGTVAVGKDADIVEAVSNANMSATFGLPMHIDDEGADESELKKQGKRNMDANARNIRRGRTPTANGRLGRQAKFLNSMKKSCRKY